MKFQTINEAGEPVMVDVTFPCYMKKDHAVILFTSKDKALQVQCVRGRYLVEVCNADYHLEIFLKLGQPASKHDFETALQSAFESFHDFTNSYSDEAERYSDSHY